MPVEPESWYGLVGNRWQCELDALKEERKRAGRAGHRLNQKVKKTEGLVRSESEYHGHVECALWYLDQAAKAAEEAQYSVHQSRCRRAISLLKGEDSIETALEKGQITSKSEGYDSPRSDQSTAAGSRAGDGEWWADPDVADTSDAQWKDDQDATWNSAEDDWQASGGQAASTWHCDGQKSSASSWQGHATESQSAVCDDSQARDGEWKGDQQNTKAQTVMDESHLGNEQAVSPSASQSAGADVAVERYIDCYVPADVYAAVKAAGQAIPQDHRDPSRTCALSRAAVEVLDSAHKEFT
eukprot:TRINITY_DN14410_c0_g1_i1.p1 TRINITY_DN14410_c0_g1~~TRINITY_DN14410_c0_g1_i1.p1  ORF type:complete len:298 (+),score=39.88 TRINITY_DN14410_c0_g1_i1:107-1000(+)